MNSDFIVSAKIHYRYGLMKLYVETVTGKEYQIRNPLNTEEFKFKLDWEKEGRKQIEALKKLITEESPKSAEPAKREIVRKRVSKPTS